MSAGGSLKVILGSLACNLGIACAKGVAAFLTGSGALLAEAIHSSADCMNQVLLLVGGRQAARPPSEMHPLGHGRAAYFWSFLVALMIFFGGGVFSIREGIEKVMHPDPVEHVWVGFAVLGVSLLMEGLALWQCVIALNERRGGSGFLAYLRRTTDADLVVLFAENAAAVVGLCIAFLALALAAVSGDARWDGVGSIVIGALLTIIAIFLAREVASLLMGERADASIEAALREEAAADPQVGSVLRVLTVQQGPGQVMLAAKLKVPPALAAGEVAHAFNRLEARMRVRCPDVKWQFLEPDVED